MVTSLQGHQFSKRLAATPREAALASLIGIAARRSIEQERPVKIEELVKI